MVTVIFVHGTGVRDLEMFEQIASSLKSRRSDLDVVACPWGRERGSKLNAEGKSIPEYNNTRAIERVEDGESIIWHYLYQDPFYELRILAIISRNSTDFIPGRIPPSKELRKRVRELDMSSELSALKAKAKEAGIADFLDDARKEVIDSIAYKEALKKLTNVSEVDAYRTVIARAIIATAMLLCEKSQKYAVILTDAKVRDQLTHLLSSELGNSSRSLGGDMIKQVWKVAAATGVADWMIGGVIKRVQRKRGAITDEYFPIPGDILLYQARGGPIRQLICEYVQQAKPPVVLLAHSLGGVACVDLLVEKPLSKVVLLVTVGSQASLFYELGALHSMPYVPEGDPLPAHFPNWLNVYDLNDYLSYICEGVFAERARSGRVKDIEVNNGQPFKRSHSAYWTNHSMWDEIVAGFPNG